MTTPARTLKEVIRAASMAGYIGAEAELRVRQSRGAVDADWSRWYEDMAVTQARIAAHYANQALDTILSVPPSSAQQGEETEDSAGLIGQPIPDVAETEPRLNK